MIKAAAKQKNIIWGLAIIALILLAIGLFFLTTTSAPSALTRFGDSFYYLKKQLMHGILPGMILGLIAYMVPLDRFRKTIPYLFGANLILMVLLLLPYFGQILGGSRRWLQVGSISFQPAELLKIAFILYFAHLAATFAYKKQYRKIFLIFLGLMITIGVLLLLQPDLSTFGVIVITGLSMYIAVGMPFGNICLLFFLAGLSFWLLTLFSDYRLDRLKTFLNPGESSLAAGYQFKQMLYAIGSGGLAGLGLGLSRQKFGFLPHSISDSIFAIIAEETGFIGAVILVALFVTLGWLGIRLALHQKDQFRQLVIIGVTVWIVAQAFVHIAANVGLIPLTGMPLPFISYGGSALTAQLIGLGFLLNAAKE